MTNIKIPTIFLLASFGIYFVLFNLLGWLEIPIALVCLCVFVFLNIGAFGVKGAIKKLVLWADLALALFVGVALLPNWQGTYFVVRYFMGIFILVFAGLLVAVLVNAYREKEG